MARGIHDDMKENVFDTFLRNNEIADNREVSDLGYLYVKLNINA